MTGATVSRHRGRHHGHCPLEGFVSAAAGTPRQPSGHAGTDDDRRQRRRERQRVLASAAHAGRGAAARRGHRAAGGERPLTRQGRQSRCLGTAVERWLVGGTRRFVGQMRPPPSCRHRRRPPPAPPRATGLVLSDLRSPIDSATGFPQQQTPRYAAASSAISERQRVSKSRRCSARGIGCTTFRRIRACLDGHSDRLLWVRLARILPRWRDAQSGLRNTQSGGESTIRAPQRRDESQLLSSLRTRSVASTISSELAAYEKRR